jgi:formamidopyrimidine-DNA glycosylase
MPELPDVQVYVEALSSRIVGATFQNARLASPFFLRTYDPPIEAAFERRVTRVQRLGKRLVLCLEEELYLVLHLMIAGRLLWKASQAKITGKIGLAALDFDTGSLIVTEASPKKRASLHLLRGKEALCEFDRGGIEVLEATQEAFREKLLCENHTLKRSLTDPRLFSGIGNAYSDEILHRAQLSPLTQTKRLKEEEIQRLYLATQQTLLEWIERLRREAGESFPEKVTAFRPEMAVHGKFGQPCPVCQTKVERIVYSESATTVPVARPVANGSRIGVCRACSRRIGRAISTISARSPLGPWSLWRR